MMKARIFVYLFIAGIVSIILSSLAAPNEKFYYAFNEKVPLFEKPNTILVKYSESIKKAEEEKFLEESLPNVKIKWHNPMLAEVDCRSEKAKKTLQLKLKTKSEIKLFLPFYVTKNNVNKGVTDEILVRFLPNVSELEKIKLHEKFGAQVLKTTNIYQKLVVPKGTDVLETANRYYETGLFEFAYPCFVTSFKPCQVFPNDTYFGNQITCHNTGQIFTDGHIGTNDADIDAPDVWGITTGSNDIVIAVLDQGVTSDHPDLPNSRQVRLTDSDFVSNDNDPSPIGDENHGNACAGVIAATMNNNQGIAGIAPNCRIMPIRMLGGGAGPDDIADAIQFAVDNGADILSNSWGNGSNNPNDEPSIVTAINYAISHNRVVVFAAGNNANHHENDNGYVAFPANVNIPAVITVGASDRNDNQAIYSPSSILLDIVAPSNHAMPWQNVPNETYEMWSIDIPNSAGYNPWQGPLTPPAIGEVSPSSGTNHLAYTARFGGTSHACPVVAGVAALMLSVNPNLTNLEVFAILMNTAEDVGGYAYTNGRCAEMGHGRVNAHAAVRAALMQGVAIVGPATICGEATYTIESLPQGASVDWNAANSSVTFVHAPETGKALFQQTGYTNSEIQASVILNADTIGTLTLPVNICQPVISGPSQVCPGSNVTFTASNLLAGCTWDCSGSLSFVSSSGSSATFSSDTPGPGIVYVKNGTSVVASKSVTVEIGPISISGSSSISANSNQQYTATMSCPFSGAYSWKLVNYYDVTDVQTIRTSNPAVTVYSKPGGLKTSVSYMLTVSAGGGESLIKVIGGSPYQKFSMLGALIPIPQLSISPNPTTSESTVTIETESAEETFDETAEWDLEVYNASQLLKEKLTGLRGQSTKIQTAGWKEGVYLVRVMYKGEILTGKLVVKR